MTWLILSVFLAAGVALRLSSLHDPLDADAGAHFYYAQHRRSVPQLHHNVVTGKPFGLYFINCIVHDFLGSGPVAARLSLIIAHTLTSFFVFLAGREIGGDGVGLFAALMYGVTSAIPEFRSNFSHPANYVTLFSTVGVFLVLKGGPQGSPMLLGLAGLAIGMAYLCKQTGLLVFGLLLTWSTVFYGFHPAMDVNPMACAALVAGFVVPPLLTLPLFASEGKKQLKDYSGNVLLQPVRAAVGKDSYVATHYEKSFRQDLEVMKAQFRIPLRETSLVWLLAFAALPYAITHIGGWTLIALWTLIMIAGGLIQRHYATPHFLPALPGASILAGYSLVDWTDTLRNPPFFLLGDALFWVVTAIIALWFIRIAWREIYLSCFCSREEKLCKLWGAGGSLMVAGEKIGRYFGENTTPKETVFQFGDNTAIYFYANREAPWHKMHWLYPKPTGNWQEQLVNCVNHRRPTYITFMTPQTHEFLTMARLKDRLIHDYEFERLFHQCMPVFRRSAVEKPPRKIDSAALSEPVRTAILTVAAETANLAENLDALNANLPPKCKRIAVAEGPSAETFRLLRTKGWTTLLRYDTGHGGKRLHDAFKKAASGKLLVIDSSVRLGAGSVERLAVCVAREEDAGLAVPTVNRGRSSQINELFRSDKAEDADEFAGAIAVDHKDEAADIISMDPGCMVISPAAREAVPAPEREYATVAASMEDYVLRVQQKCGLRSLVALDSFAFVQAPQPVSEECKEADERTFMEKWEVSMDVKRQVEELQLEGHTLFAAGQPMRALQKLFEGIKTWNRHAMLWNDAGVTEWQLGKLDEAYNHLANAMKLAPENEMIANNFYRVAWEAGKSDDAEELLVQLLRIRVSQMVNA